MGINLSCCNYYPSVYREAAAIDGQICVGDRILEVNGVCLDSLPSYAAIQTLHEEIRDKRYYFHANSFCALNICCVLQSVREK